MAHESPGEAVVTKGVPEGAPVGSKLARVTAESAPPDVGNRAPLAAVIAGLGRDPAWKLRFDAGRTNARSASFGFAAEAGAAPSH